MADDERAVLERLFDVAQALQAYIPSRNAPLREEVRRALVSARTLLLRTET